MIQINNYDHHPWNHTLPHGGLESRHQEANHLSPSPELAMFIGLAEKS
jgi:hypothetical protein